MSEHGGGRRWLVVGLALAANAAIGLLKLAAGLLTGSGALLSEAAHSAGDSIDRGAPAGRAARSDTPGRPRAPVRLRQGALLLVAARRGGDLRVRRGFSIFQGLHTILGPTEPAHAAVDQLHRPRARGRPRGHFVPPRRPRSCASRRTGAGSRCARLCPRPRGPDRQQRHAGGLGGADRHRCRGRRGGRCTSSPARRSGTVSPRW